MLIKLLNVRKLTSFSRHVHHKPSSAQPEAEETHHPLLALKLVHAGGNVECYYMAVPASRIMEKYPSFVLARPEVFRRPWDSVVRREEILNPGEKFFVVPRRTVKKLRQKIQKPNGDNLSVNLRSFVSQSSNDVSAEMGSLRKKDDPGKVSSGIFRQRRREVSSSSEASETETISVERKRSAKHNIKHVRFSGVSPKQIVEKKKGNAEENSRKKSNSYSKKSKSKSKSNSNSNSQEDHERTRRVRNSVTWHPTLDAISETSKSDE